MVNCKGSNYCQCGCGEEIPLVSKHRGEPQQFKYHHQTPKGEKNPNWKGGRTYDSAGYVKIKHPSSPNKSGQVREHRLVMELFLGRQLTKDEHVHHINGDKKDNRIENLELTNISKHNKHHIQQRRENKLFKRNCIYCGKNKTWYNKKKNEYVWHFYKYDKTKPVCHSCRNINQQKGLLP